MTFVVYPKMSDKVHRILGGIYLLSIEPVNEHVDFREQFEISSVLSVICGPLAPYLTHDYRHLQIEINDEETVNILNHLPKAIAFIDSALFSDSNSTEMSNRHRGSVLIHCAQGQSRSVSIILAYLMYRYNLTLHQAMHAVKRKVPDADPNSGFLEQLSIFKEMGCKIDKTSKLYKGFLISNSIKLDPSGGQLRELGLWQNSGKLGDDTNSEYNLRCKRCRTILATESDIETHETPDSESRQSQFIKTAPNSRRIISRVEASKTCSHYFLDEPMPWMGDELAKQDMEGKFACPKCEAKVGGYSWKGSRCSCGKWMIPALHLQTAKVDLMKRHGKSPV